MNILFVCNNAHSTGNGISVSAVITIRQLRLHGHDARLMAMRNPDPSGYQPDYQLKHFKFPFLEPMIYANGFSLAKIDRKVIKEAVEWADVVHLEEAMPLQGYVLQMALSRGKPCTATYHLFTYNVTANLGLRQDGWFNEFYNKVWRVWIYNKCSDIQCPTPVVAEYLKARGFTSRLHVISNGIPLPEKPVVPKEILPEGVIDVLTVGRYSREKALDVLLDAMRYSRYADRIRLTIAGKGSLEQKLREQAAQLLSEGVLRHEPVFHFYSREELPALMANAYLYVHCATVEIEGLSCLEATREGAVPIIGEGPMVGTTRFALYPESIYPILDSRALAERIDWWIEHPAERNAASLRYAETARSYSIDASIDALEAMFRQAVGEKCAD